MITRRLWLLARMSRLRALGLQLTLLHGAAQFLSVQTGQSIGTAFLPGGRGLFRSCRSLALRGAAILTILLHQVIVFGINAVAQFDHILCLGAQFLNIYISLLLHALQDALLDKILILKIGNLGGQILEALVSQGGSYAGTVAAARHTGTVRTLLRCKLLILIIAKIRALGSETGGTAGKIRTGAEILLKAARRAGRAVAVITVPAVRAAGPIGKISPEVAADAHRVVTALRSLT